MDADDGVKGFRLTGRTYITRCLQKIASDMKFPRIYQHDGAKCHTALCIRRYLASKGISQLSDWPSHSPDLNVIEQLWALLNQRISEKRPTTQQQLEQAVRDVWNQLDQRMINKYVLSFKSKLEACLRKRGKC